MKTAFTSLLMVFIFSQNVFSQKIKTKYVSVEYTKLPTKPLDKNFKTYSVSVTDPFASLKAGNLNAESLVKSHLNLDGFKPIDGISDFHININIGQYVFLGHETKEETENKTRKVTPKTDTSSSSTASKSSNEKARQTTATTKKTTQSPDKTSTQTKTTTETYTVTTYYKSIDYYLPISYSIIDFQGNKINEGTLIDSNKKLNYIYGKNTSDPKYLEDKFKKDFTKTTAGMVSLTINNNFKSLGKWVKGKYDYQKKREKIYMRTLSKKSDGATEFNSAFTKVKNALEKMKYNEPIDHLKSEVRPAIETWLKLKETYPTNKKKGRKGRHACLYNIAATFYWLEEFGEAEKYAKEGIAVGSKEKHLERLLKTINTTKKSMHQNKVKTRHIERDLENYVQHDMMPTNVTNPTPQSLALPKDAISFDGFIVNEKGDKIKGRFIISNNKKKELEFGKQGNIEFHWKKNNMPQVDYLEPNKIKTFSFNNRMFNCQAYKTALDNDASKQKIMECLFDSKQIKVFKYYPYEQGVNNNQTEISLQRASDPSPISTVGDNFLIFKRGLSEFFKDCKELSDLALTGEFDKSEVDIVRAAKAYTQYCKS